MRYNSSGFLEEKISLLGLGSQRLPLDNCSGVFDTAFKNKVSFFYVSPSSGKEAENIFGANFSALPRSEYYLAGGLSLFDIQSETDAESFVCEQLCRLKTGYFDYYILENICDETFFNPKFQKIYSSVLFMKKLGKIRHIGFSFTGDIVLLKAVLEKYSWDFAKIDLNYYNWNFLGADNAYREIKKRKIPFIASDPFMGKKLLELPENALDVLKNCDPLFSCEEWALRWFFDKKGLLCIIADPGSSEEFLEYVKIISGTKTLNSNKKHCLKMAANLIHGIGCGDAG